MPGLTPQEEKESEGKRGLSQSERDCGLGKGWVVGLRRLVEEGLDIVGFLTNRRGFKGKEISGVNLRIIEVVGLEEEKKMKREKAVKIKSGKEVGFLWR